MAERRWVVYAAAALVVAVAAGLIGFAAGSAGSAGRDEVTTSDGGQAEGLIRQVNGIPVGIAPTRAGAAAAADNYVAIATETIVQDPERYEQLVRTAYAPNYQEQALQEGRGVRERSAGALAEFASGGKLVAASVARQVNAFDPSAARVTSWTMVVGWGPESDPVQFWTFNEVELAWDGQRWTVARLDESARSAPTPTLVFGDDEDKTTDAFERELQGFSAPQYGG